MKIEIYTDSRRENCKNAGYVNKARNRKRLINAGTQPRGDLIASFNKFIA
jgi:hypothetical protein